MKVSRARFEELAEAAYGEIPRYFRDKLHNLSIEVKDSPGREAGGDKDLLGLYVGPTREELRETGNNELLPARIMLYRNNLQAMTQSEEELMREIRLTLRHEIAHHFGFTDADIEERWPEGA